jgi:para-nitrobenzyl esterase
MKRLALFASVGAVILSRSSTLAMVPEQVRVDTGLVEGVTGAIHPTVRIFKGVPFAAPPVGENRWRAPLAAAKWDGVFKANAFGPSCIGGGGAGRGGRGAPGRAGAPSADGRGARGSAPTAAAAPAAPQAPRQPPASEDCLTLNVWTSATRPNDKRPVMLWIYGGGFIGGSGGNAWYDGEDLAVKGPVIVTMNYRLGAFGFFAHPELAKEAGHSGSGNYGMMDAIAALKWIKRNISAFGGDPNNVTIAGESAGAFMVGALVGSPQAKNLFNRAIAESGTWIGMPLATSMMVSTGLQPARMMTAGQAQENGAKALEAAGIKSIAELRAKPLAEIPNLGTATLVIDGHLIPEDLAVTFAQGKQNDVDLLAGSNKNESSLLGGGRGGRGGGDTAAAGSAREGYIARAKQEYGDLADTFLKLYPVGSDADVPLMQAQVINDEMTWNMRHFAALQSKKGRKGYAYFFTRGPMRNGQPQPNGASHTAEISYVFNHAYSNGPLEWNDVDKTLSDTMSSYWVNFITKGDPNGSRLPAWPRYKDTAKDKVIVLGDTVEVEAAPPAEKLAFYNSRFAQMTKVQVGTAVGR